MSYYIAYDGVTVHRYTTAPEGIKLDNGLRLREEFLGNRIFAVHPDDSKFVTRVNGIYHYRGVSLGRPEPQ